MGSTLWPELELELKIWNWNWNWNCKLWNWNWNWNCKIWKCRNWNWNWNCKIGIDPSPDCRALYVIALHWTAPWRLSTIYEMSFVRSLVIYRCQHRVVSNIVCYVLMNIRHNSMYIWSWWILKFTRPIFVKPSLKPPRLNTQCFNVNVKDVVTK